MSNIDDSANTNPASDTKMGYSTPLSGFKEVDYDEWWVIPVGSYMDWLPMEIRFAIVYSVCWILDRFPDAISPEDIQESFELLRPEHWEVWKRFYREQVIALGIELH